MRTNNENAINLYRFSGESYCKAMDILRMIHHEMDEADCDKTRSVLSRMRMRLVRNEMLDPNKGALRDNTCIPGRYAVAYQFGIGYRFYSGKQGDGKPVFIGDPGNAKLFVTYREASAVADFTDEHDCVVLDMHNFLSEADRFRRAMLIPYDADEGNSEAIQPDFVP